MYRLLVYVLLAADLVRLVMYGSDKAKAAKDRWRTRESTLLLIAIPGGVGAFLGMKLFRHKTQKWYFKLVCGMRCMAQIVLLVYLKTRSLI